VHELSLAMSIVEAAQEEGARHEGRVSAVYLRVGRMSGVVTEALQSAFGMACEGTPLEGSRLEIDEIPIEAFCPSCQSLQPIESVFLMVCPRCGTPVSDIRKGRELEVAYLEIV
jgi:hydrogenase nickel incorporation protein HypA/HybF